jgi:hypothetical protein
MDTGAMIESTDPFAVAPCLACGAVITRLEAPLHIEDHAQRGELPTADTEEPRRFGSQRGGASRPVEADRGRA